MNLRRYAAVALVLALGGCSKTSSSTKPEPEEQAAGCDVVADRVITLLEPEAEKAGELRDALVRLCNEDEWPVGARGCVVDAQSHDEAEECAHQFLSDDAYRRVGDEMARILDDSDDGNVGMPPE